MQFLKSILLGMVLVASSTFYSAQTLAADDDVIIENAQPAQATLTEDALTISVGASTYVMSNPKPTDDIYKAYADLPPDQAAQFHEKREAFLKSFAKTLGVMKYGFGIASLLKEKISYRRQRMVDQLWLREIRNYPSTIQADAMLAYETMMRENMIKANQRAEMTLRQRSSEIITHALKSIDQQLWAQAALFSHSNEFGVMLAGGLEAMGGVQGKGGFGGIFDIGISVGYNHEQNALVLQLHRDVEGFKSTALKAVAIAGALGKFGIYVANQKATGGLHKEGTTFYPPMVPGFTSITRDSFIVGLSSGLTIPPSPFGDVLTYTTALDQRALLRLTVSPLTKGYVRVQFGNIFAATKFIVQPVLNAVKWVSNAVRPGNGGMCKAAFSPAAG